MLRVGSRLMTATAVGYALALLLLALVWLAAPELTWWVRLSAIFGIWLYAPLPLVALLAAARPNPPRIAAAALGLALFAWQFGPGLLPHPTPLGQSGRPQGVALRAMTYNQLYSNTDMPQILAAIVAQRPDIVAMQELPYASREALSRDLIREYPYQLYSDDGASYELGMLSRYPLRALPADPVLPAIVAVATTPAGDVTVVNLHLSAPRIETSPLRLGYWLNVPSAYATYFRDMQGPRLLALLDATSGPLIVLGDHNTSDREPLYRQLAARLTDAYRATSWGPGYTFPNHISLGIAGTPVRPPPLVRIDYVWSRDGVAPAAARVVCQSGGSDHCMVVADLVVTGTAAHISLP